MPSLSTVAEHNHIVFAPLLAAFAVQALNPQPTFVDIVPSGFEKAKQPQVALDDKDNVYVAYGVGNAIHLSISTDGGKSFGEPIKVAEQGKLALGRRRGPRISVSKGVIGISAICGKTIGQHHLADGDLYFWASSDNGKTWTEPRTINDVPNAAREGLHAMAATNAGLFACTWLDMREKGTTLYTCFSSDSGGTWSKNQLAYSSPSGTICECCHPSAAFDKNGKLFLMFRNSIDGYRDMYLLSTPDAGKTFTEASMLGSTRWKLDACPMDGGGLAIDERGSPLAAWRTEGTNYFGSALAENVLGQGEQAWVSANKSGQWTAYSAGEVIVKSPGDIFTLERGAFPTIAALRKGGAFVAWEVPGKGIRGAIVQ